jgi:hypothetical protein
MRYQVRQTELKMFVKEIVKIYIASSIKKSWRRYENT